MSEMYVVRHGQASFLAEDYDALSALGREQMACLAQFWLSRGLEFQSVYIGPRRRHRQSFDELCQCYETQGKGLGEPVILQGLDEYPVDSYLRPEVWARHPELVALNGMKELYGSDTNTETKQRSFQRLFSRIAFMWVRGGLVDSEIVAWTEFQRQVSLAIQQMVATTGKGKAILVISSAGTTGAIIQRAVDCSDEKALEIGWRKRNASVSRFLFEGSRFNLDVFNAMEHLDSEEMRTFR